MMLTPVFKRILLKVSGEGLSEGQTTGFSEEILGRLSQEIKTVRKAGVDVCLVVGGGNFFRGKNISSEEVLSARTADFIGMTATLLNGQALKEAFSKAGLDAEIFSALELVGLCPKFDQEKAIHALKQGKVVILTGGLGEPGQTTDTAAAQRAIQLQCDAMFKMTQVDGVYTADPKKDPTAQFLESVSYETALKNHLKVLDEKAILLVQQASLPIYVFNQHRSGLLEQVVCGKGRFTVMNEKGEK